MKKIFVVTSILALLALMVPVLAQPVDIRTEFYASGTTHYNELATISGLDWTEGMGNPAGCPGWTWPPTAQVTAYVAQDIDAKGEFYLNKEVRSTGPWEMQEDAEMWGTGPANIKKEVAWWTEDSKQLPNGKLMYPTVANIYTFFGAGDVDPFTPGLQYQVTDEDELHNVANEPPAQDYTDAPNVGNVFNKQYLTPLEFEHMESVGINMPLRCDHNKPIQPEPPVCDDC
jgi:hypothetical protein